MLARRRPGATLTAAVRGKLNEGYNDYLQNAVAWLRTGLIDVAYPMAYTENLSDFERMVGDYRTLAPGACIVPGVGIYKHDTADEIGRQLDYCLRNGGDFALFSYESLFPVYTERAKEKPDSKTEKLRTMRREVLSRAVAAKHR